MLKKRKLRKREFSTSLNITSLLDVLTVLLFFLIKSMSVTSVSLSTPDDIRLPASYIEANAQEAVVLALSSQRLTVDSQEIAVLKNGKFSKSDIGPDSRTLLPLEKVLARKYKQRLALFEGIEGVDPENIPVPKLLIQGDKDISFGLVKYMLHTVAKVGYTDYQFIVVPKS